MMFWQALKCGVVDGVAGTLATIFAGFMILFIAAAMGFILKFLAGYWTYLFLTIWATITVCCVVTKYNYFKKHNTRWRSYEDK